MKIKDYLESKCEINRTSATRLNRIKIMELLEAHGPLTPREISKITGWEVTKTQSIMQRMQNDGIIEPRRGWRIIKRLD